MQKETVVAVTHIINPHLFWYHNVYDFDELNHVEQQLQAISKSRDCYYHPKLAETVAVNFVAWNKIIRAEVLCEAKWRNEFIVWALDYGFPFRIRKEYIHRLPTEMMGHIDHIRCGGLANILPGESEFDYMEGKLILIRKDNWMQAACDILEKLLMGAESVTFVEEFQSEDNRHWGNLIVVNHKGQVFSVREHLLSAKCALEAAKFQDIALELKTIQIRPHLSNCGKLTMRTNTVKSNRSDLCTLQNSGHAIDAFAKSKVEDWCVCNNHETKLMDNMSTRSVRMAEQADCNSSESVQSTPQQKPTSMPCVESVMNKQDICSYRTPTSFHSSMHRDKQKSIDIENADIEEAPIVSWPTVMDEKDRKKKLPSPYDNFTMVPGGFDITRLSTYRNEETHWHRKNTTLKNNH
uniref:Tudor domain-containing protein n=1 Tax=Glossina brevipalpis TaxID=37001 RepID=A0A1A9WZX4_9MUSC